MAATVVTSWLNDSNITTATEPYAGTSVMWVYARTWFNDNTAVSTANAAEPIVAKPKPCTWPFPAPTDLVAGPVRVAMVESQAVPRRPVMQALRGRDRRPLRARPGRRGVLRRQAEQEDEQ